MNDSVALEKLREIVLEAQRLQPNGSPPPGDEVLLVTWILRSLRDRILYLEKELVLREEKIEELETSIEVASHGGF